MVERCDTCRLWRRLTEFAGECHALAPMPVLYDPAHELEPSPDGLRVAWPVTLSADGCGAWCPPPVRQQEGGQTL